MERHDTTRDFFRLIPNALLARYFGGRGLFRDLDFGAMKEEQSDALFEAWLSSPDAEFKEILELGCEKGFRVILDEAEWHLGKMAEHAAFVWQLAALSNHFERAMVTFLEHPAYGKGARFFYPADSFACGPKRKKLPCIDAAVDEVSLQAMADALRTYFRHTEGRGENCIVDPFRRGEIDYSFCYPEDYFQQTIEWVGGE